MNRSLSYLAVSLTILIALAIADHFAPPATPPLPTVRSIYYQTPPRARRIEPQPPPTNPAPAPILTSRSVFSGIVMRVIDGDSIVVGDIEIRLTDFNAPEYNEPGGTEARLAMTEIALNQSVVCQPCVGARISGQCMSYDRVLATCRLNGVGLGDLMRGRGIREGGN